MHRPGDHHKTADLKPFRIPTSLPQRSGAAELIALQSLVDIPASTLNLSSWLPYDLMSHSRAVNKLFQSCSPAVVASQTTLHLLHFILLDKSKNHVAILAYLITRAHLEFLNAFCAD